MLAALLKVHNQFKLVDVPVPEIGPGDVLIRVKTCGFCGSEAIAADYGAPDWRPFGHEFAGIVEKIGARVSIVEVGDQVVVECSIFNPLSREARNGRPELDGRDMPDLINYIDFDVRSTMGFAEYTTAPAELCVKFERMSFLEGAMIEPMGVAMDLVRTADIQLNDDVLIVGLGPIGLMALQLARRMGARRIYAANRSHGARRIELAKRFGADEIICTDQVDLAAHRFERGGVDKALITAPPALIPPTTHCMNIGGIVAFLGLAEGDKAMITLDSNLLHGKKLQIRASDAVPALYFPMCIELVESGAIDVRSLITHTFPLRNVPEGLSDYLNHHAEAVKAVMVNDD